MKSVECEAGKAAAQLALYADQPRLIEFYASLGYSGLMMSN